MDFALCMAQREMTLLLVHELNFSEGEMRSISLTLLSVFNMIQWQDMAEAGMMIRL